MGFRHCGHCSAPNTACPPVCAVPVEPLVLLLSLLLEQATVTRVSTTAAPSTRAANLPRIPVPLSQSPGGTQYPWPFPRATLRTSTPRPVVRNSRPRRFEVTPLWFPPPEASGSDEVDQARHDLHAGE